MGGVKETMCTRCAHCEVCALKNNFLAAQEAVDNTTVYLDSDDGKVRMMKIHDMPFIKPVNLECKYYMAQQMGIREASQF